MKMRTIVAAIGLATLMIIAVVSGISCRSEIQLTDTVTIDSGLAKGRTEEDIHVFLGIPYAAPPVGDLRWKPPQPVEPWDGVLAATEFGPACCQIKTRHQVGEMSEDCLHLNIWTPARTTDEKLPVMIWIHGGGYVSEWSGQPEFDGTNLAKKGVVLVTLDYRLWAFGFLVHPELAEESLENVSGNYGLLDQRAAFRWVKNNIAAFGGDPNQVTIFGESAGAMSVAAHVASPLSRGLFERAISQSGTIQDGAFPHATGSLDEATDTGLKYAEVLDCDQTDDVLACMRGKTSQELLDVAVPLMAATGVRPSNAVSNIEAINFAPVYDGWFFPEDATDIFLKVEQNQVPYMIGFNGDEGTLFVDDPSESEGYTQKAFVEPSKLVAGSTQAPVYFYTFTRIPHTEEAAKYGAFHSIEIPYVFGNLDASEGYDDMDFRLSDLIMDYWVNFAKTGDPNGSGLPYWQPYSSETEQYLDLGNEVTVRSGL